MAQKVVYLLTDDLDGGDASSTVTFGLDSATYEIDLSDAHADELRAALAPYVAVARKVGGRKAARGASRRGGNGEVSANQIRSWAVAQGMTVSSRGRVSAEVREAYDRAHS